MVILRMPCTMGPIAPSNSWCNSQDYVSLIAVFKVELVSEGSSIRIELVSEWRLFILKWKMWMVKSSEVRNSVRCFFWKTKGCFFLGCKCSIFHNLHNDRNTWKIHQFVFQDPNHTVTEKPQWQSRLLEETSKINFHSLNWVRGKKKKSWKLIKLIHLIFISFLNLRDWLQGEKK